jgi:hypothetical protein
MSEKQEPNREEEKDQSIGWLAFWLFGLPLILIVVLALLDII